MTARKTPSKTTAPKPARKTAPKPKKTPPKTAPRQRKPRAAAKTAGQRLVTELSKDDDTYSVQILIERAGQTADWLERLDRIINGEQRAWIELSIDGDTVSVVVDSPIREARQLQSELRHLLAEIFRQRAKLPGDDDGDDDVLAGL